MKTVYRRPPGRNPHDTPVVVDGYGIRINVERGHLVLHHGTGRDRVTTRYPKVGHGIGRIVIVGHTGSISLEAIRWLDRVGIPYTHMDHEGTILAGHANPGVDDPRLRRAQALAPTTPVGLAIAKALIAAKLHGQSRVAAVLLDDPALTDSIAAHAKRTDAATTIAELAAPEQRGAYEYWGGWIEHVTVSWARTDRDRVPEHWTRFPRRRSQFTSDASRASDPTNALLNYLYRLAEIECRTACIRLGLDPGLGIIHADTKNRDSLALDLIEAIRPDVDAYVLELLRTRTFRRRDFHELDDGELRILAPLTHELAGTIPMWAAAVAPIAENVRRHLADASPYQIEDRRPLTNRRRKTSPTTRPPMRRVQTAKSCPDCGSVIASKRSYCDECAARRQREGRRYARQRLAAVKAADPGFRQRLGRSVSDTKRERHAQAIEALGYSVDDWARFQPQVATLSLSAIRVSTGLGVTQASRIKSGKHVPDARYWTALLQAAAAEPAGS